MRETVKFLNKIDLGISGWFIHDYDSDKDSIAANSDYEKVLELNPENTNALEKLKQLQKED